MVRYWPNMYQNVYDFEISFVEFIHWPKFRKHAATRIKVFLEARGINKEVKCFIRPGICSDCEVLCVNRWRFTTRVKMMTSCKTFHQVLFVKFSTRHTLLIFFYCPFKLDLLTQRKKISLLFSKCSFNEHEGSVMSKGRLLLSKQILHQLSQTFMYMSSKAICRDHCTIFDVIYSQSSIGNFY